MFYEIVEYTLCEIRVNGISFHLSGLRNECSCSQCSPQVPYLHRNWRRTPLYLTKEEQGGCLCRYNPPATSGLELRLFLLEAKPLTNTWAQLLCVWENINQVDFKYIKQGVNVLYLNLTYCRIFGLCQLDRKSVV